MDCENTSFWVSEFKVTLSGLSSHGYVPLTPSHPHFSGPCAPCHMCLRKEGFPHMGPADPWPLWEPLHVCPCPLRNMFQDRDLMNVHLLQQHVYSSLVLIRVQCLCGIWPPLLGSQLSLPQPERTSSTAPEMGGQHLSSAGLFAWLSCFY